MIDEIWMNKYERNHQSVIQLMMGSLRIMPPYGEIRTIEIMIEPEFWIVNEILSFKLNAFDYGVEMAMDLMLNDIESNSWCNPHWV